MWQQKTKRVRTTHSGIASKGLHMHLQSDTPTKKYRCLLNPVSFSSKKKERKKEAEKRKAQSKQRNKSNNKNPNNHREDYENDDHRTNDLSKRSRKSTIKDKHIIERRTISCTDDELQNFLGRSLKQSHAAKTSCTKGSLSSHIKLKTEFLNRNHA